MTHDFTNTNDFQIDTTDSFWAGLSAAEQANVAANATFLAGQVEVAFTTTTGGRQVDMNWRLITTVVHRALALLE